MNRRRLFSALMISLLLVSVLSVVFDVPIVEASGTIYIRADGSIDPPTAPIQRDGDLYTLTGNITSDSDGIVIERNNMILDGADYTVQREWQDIGTGINLTGRSNITIENVKVTAFRTSILLDSSSNSYIVRNSLVGNGFGIWLENSLYNTISGNELTNNEYHASIRLIYSSYNTISGNNLTENNYGIMLEQSRNNRLRENIMANKADFEVYGVDIRDYLNDIDSSNTVDSKPLYYWINERNAIVPLDAGYVALVNCTNITAKNLNLRNSRQGILLAYTTNSTITQNNIIFGWEGIKLHGSSSNIISSNNLTTQMSVPGAGLAGIYLRYSSSNILFNNNVSLTYHCILLEYYSKNNTISRNNAVNGCVGIQATTYSDYNNIVDNKLMANNDYGIWLIETLKNTVSGNTITQSNYGGVVLYGWRASYNTVSENYLANNGRGIFLSSLSSSSNNKFYHNDFVNNTKQVYCITSGYANIWDDGYPSGGNYWSDYIDVDQYSGLNQDQPGGDGIWDHPYTIDANNTDHYPLVNPWIPPAPDFLISASPTSLTIQQGDSDTSLISITSMNGFSQPVQLAVSGAPLGVTATLNPEQVTPPPDDSITSTLTVSVDTTATLGDYTLTVTGTNGTLTHSVDISLTITQVGEWSFAIITDLHIGWGYCDYGDAGYDDPNLGATQDYWLTSRLEKVVERINETRSAQNIKFVVVLGDIADTAEKSEFLKAREILSKLNDPNGDGDTTDGIPYIPVIGNHDIWPYTMKQGIDPDKRDEIYVATTVDKTNYNPDNLGDRYFQKIFWEDQESQDNRDLITRIFGSSWQNQSHSSAPYLQNYKFRFGGMNFVCLDFNPRDPNMAFPGSDQGALVQPFNDTRNWFSTFLEENKNRQTIAFCHHPFHSAGGFTRVFRDVQGQAELNNMVNYIKSNISDYNVKVVEFGGHTHVNDASTYFTTFGDLVVETEAVLQESAEIIRIVKVKGQMILNYNIREGVSGDPGLSMFFTLGTGAISNDQSAHFMSQPIDFMEGCSLPARFHQKNYVDISTFFFRWDFGDGERVEGWGNPDVNGDADDPYHSYKYAGLYLLNLTIGTPDGVIKLNEYPIFISGELSPMRYIAGLPENMWAVSTGRDVSVKKADGDGQNTFESILISKVASPETPVVEFGVHFENATEDIDLSTLVAGVNIMKRKAFFYMPSWPVDIENLRSFFIPSTGGGFVYLCLNVTSLDEVNLENSDLILKVGETRDNITVTTTFYDGKEYYLIYGNITSLGGGEISHDIAIANITFSEYHPNANETIQVYVTVENRGNFTETFGISLNFTLLLDPLIGTQNITLESETKITLNFTWTPTDAGRYKIEAYISMILDDKNPSDNIKTKYFYVLPFVGGPYYTQLGIEYWLVELIEGRVARVVSNYC